MNYILMPSLEHMALIKIAITLWNQEETTSMQTYFTNLLNTNEWENVENIVIKKVQQLSQPDVFKEKILCYIKPIGTEILHWLRGNWFDYFGTQGLNKFCWTPQGTIDGKKTVETCIKNNNFEIRYLYMFACRFCVEEEIPKLWNSMSECDREVFYKNNRVTQAHNDLVVYWTYVVLGKVDEWKNITFLNSYGNNCSANQAVIFSAARSGLKEALKYFFPKLNSRERTESLSEVADYFPFSFVGCDLCIDVLPFCDKEQELEMLQKNKDTILKGFLSWPWQPLFMEMANRVKNFLSGGESYTYLHNIVDILIRGHKDYNYKKLLGEFWQQMPKAHKRYVVDEITISPLLLSKFLKIQDLENFYVILREATAEEYIKVFCHEFDRLDKNLHRMCDNFFFLPFITQVFLSSSTENKVEFVKEIKECILLNRTKEEIEREKDIWNNLFHKLDDQIVKHNKRTAEEVEEGPIDFMRKHSAKLKDD